MSYIKHFTRRVDHAWTETNAYGKPALFCPRCFRIVTTKNVFQEVAFLGPCRPRLIFGVLINEFPTKGPGLHLAFEFGDRGQVPFGENVCKYRLVLAFEPWLYTRHKWPLWQVHWTHHK